MVRELVAVLLAFVAGGCSLLLDFSDQAIPKDASPDAPFDGADCAYKEPNDSLAAAAAIAPSDTGPAAICPGTAEDHDFYRFTVSAPATRVEIRLDTVFRPGGDLDLRLYDGAGAVLAQSHSFSDEERIVCPGSVPACPALAGGQYVFEVFPAVTGAANRYTFTLAIAP
ncbi:MAG TPA: PPC domain-containing protein [Kofleriaceae bacterium]|nr:PPC domain-containing protein [Kofleriaceae bacterium]